MRFCLPKVQGRGAGLGNELIPWTKAFIASAELGIPLLPPAFGLNRFGYRQYFHTSRFDWITHRILSRILPTITFTEADYLATGEQDFDRAIGRFAVAHGLHDRRAYVLVLEGMWGGYFALRKATPFVWQTLYRSTGVAQKLYALRKRLTAGRVKVAVHMRLGDFAQASQIQSFQGRFNASLPLEWYMATCRSIYEAVDGRVQFILLTDGKAEQIRPFLEAFDPVTTFDLPDTVCSDLLAMAHADLIVCSVSSFSMCAAWISNVPYIWYLGNLQDHADALSLWGHESAQQPPSGVTAMNLSTVRKLMTTGQGQFLDPRGVPVDDDGLLPDTVVRYLDVRANMQQEASDLLLYGAVPKSVLVRTVHND